MQTIDLNTHQHNKDYAIRQARTARNEKAATDSPPTLDAATKSEEGANTKTPGPPWTPEEDEQWMMSMKGNGGKGKKGGKGGLCYNCGEPGHFARECPKPPSQPYQKGTEGYKGWGKGGGKSAPSDGTGCWICEGPHFAS